MKALEITEEKALQREEKFKEQIRTLVNRLKGAESRTEYGEKHITKLNHRIDMIEDDIVRAFVPVRRWLPAHRVDLSCWILKSA